MSDFICLERNLEARGISVESSRCMTIDALTSGKLMIWLLSDHADAS